MLTALIQNKPMRHVYQNNPQILVFFSTGDPLLTCLRFDQPINAGLTKKYVVYHLSYTTFN